MIDKAVALLDAVSTAPRSLAGLVSATGLPRPTAHRLALALEHHQLLTRDSEGRFFIGARPMAWSAEIDGLRTRSHEVVISLRDATGVSAQVYRRVGDQRLCLAAAEPAAGLRDSVPVGSLITMHAGSAAQILVAWLPEVERETFLQRAAYSAADLQQVRERGWAQSVAQREVGVASLSAPVRNALGEVTAAVSLSGPVERLAEATAERIRALTEAAARLQPSE